MSTAALSDRWPTRPVADRVDHCVADPQRQRHGNGPADQVLRFGRPCSCRPHCVCEAGRSRVVQVLDDRREFVRRISVLAGEADEVVDAGENSTALRGACDADAVTATKLEQSLVA
jgi:hypothetical protein